MPGGVVAQATARFAPDPQLEVIEWQLGGTMYPVAVYRNRCVVGPSGHRYRADLVQPCVRSAGFGAVFRCADGWCGTAFLHEGQWLWDGFADWRHPTPSDMAVMPLLDVEEE